MQAFYLSYSLFYLFNNTISHLVNGLDMLLIKNMYKISNIKQLFLRDK